ncbi:MAG: glycosyltransferase family 2 protein [Thermoplasmata archaeon]
MEGRTVIAPARLAVVIPTLNEEEGLRATLGDLPIAELRNLGFDPTVVVVDGHSTDRTPSVARSLGTTFFVQQGKGKGAAVREGMAWATDRGIPYVIVMDADFTYPGAALPSMATLLDAGSDLVIGVRRPDRHAMSELKGLIHRLGNSVLNLLAGYFAKGPILDVCSGLWGIRTSTLEQTPIESEGFDIEAEIFVKAFRRGLSISQVPVLYRSRVGVAKLHAFQDGARILLSILRYSRPPAAGTGPTPGAYSVTSPTLPAPTMRDLQSVLFALNSRRVFVSAPAGGSEGVSELAQRLTLANPEMTVAVIPSPPNEAAHPASESPAPPSPPAPDGQPWSIVITLPRGSLRRPGPTCTIRMPSGQRMLYVDMENTPDAAPEPPDGGTSRSQAYRLERSSDRPLSSLRILSSSIAQFAAQRDVTLIAANVAHTNYTVLRERRDPSFFRSSWRAGSEGVTADGDPGSAGGIPPA